MNALQIEKMAISSIESAKDQQFDYDSLQDALDSYRNNAIETLVDLGIGTNENFEIVNQVFDAAGAKA